LECLRKSANGTGHHDLVKELETKFQELKEKSIREKQNRRATVKQSPAMESSQQPVSTGEGASGQDVRNSFIHHKHTNS